MFPSLVVAGLFILSSTAQKILLTNDDGWAVAQIRAQFDAIEDAGFDVILSAPSENESGTGSATSPPTVLNVTCEFQTCDVGSPPEGSDPDNPLLNYVNSFPVDAVRFGIQNLSSVLFQAGGSPDFVVSGPNVGNNLGTVVTNSGTVGAACEAALEQHPSAAFSGASTSQSSFTTLQSSPTSSATLAALLYSQLTVQFLQAIFESPSGPVLPPGVTVNVNYPATDLPGCSDIDNYSFVFTRLLNETATDVETCGSTQLPDETTVVHAGCFVSVSVVGATSKRDVDADTQSAVLNLFDSSFFSCFSS